MARRLAVTLVLALTPALAGCLEREEKITVAPDGALDVVHVF